MSGNRANPNECDGNARPTLRLAEHLTQDQAQRDARNSSQVPENAEGVVGEFLDEATQDNFRTFRGDELLRQVRQVESPEEPYRCPAIPSRLFDPVAPPTPAVSPTRNWVIDENADTGLQRFSSFSYAFLPSLHLPPGVPFSPFFPVVPSRRVATCYYPQSILPIPAPSNNPYSPIPYARLSPEEPWQSPDVGDFERELSSPEESSFLEDDEQGNSGEDPENLAGGEQRGRQGSSDMEQGVDLEAFNIPEGAAAFNNDGMEAVNIPGRAGTSNNVRMEAVNIPGRAGTSNNVGMEASGSDFAEKVNARYVELLRNNQVQLDDEEDSDENSDAEPENEESDDSGPPYRMFQNLSPKFDVDDEPQVINDNARTFLHRFAGILSNVEELNKYDFEEENPMLELDDPFQEGLRRLDMGDIARAVLCFEAAAQRDSDNPLVWQYLGTTQAENEQDTYAISALRECLKLDPTNLTALMTIAISFTNESFNNAAVIMLWKWLYYNPNYSDLGLTRPPDVFWSAPSLLDWPTHMMVKEMFLMAANKNPGGNLDPDVQCGLGVLFNLQHDCDKAADCFKAALSINPNDPIMWNRLGATLSNGLRSEESVGAYYKSLDMRPGYVRARYNLGVSFINLGAYTEAIRHLMKSLYQQTRSESPTEVVGRMSDTIVTTLKVVLNHMGREDLVVAVRRGNLELVCNEFGLTLEGEEN